jgi:hypothetical protein
MELTETFTFYLKGGTQAALVACLKPWGNPGNLDRYRLDACDAEVILGSEAALLRVRFDCHELAVRDLVNGIKAASKKVGLHFSDDINSNKSADELMARFLEEKASHGYKLEGGKTSKVGGVPGWLIAVGVLVLLVVLYFFAHQVQDMGKAAHERYGF